jgi:aminoglycoside-2''-adenylyltransferase
MTETAASDQIPAGGEPMTDFTWESWTPEEVARRLSGVDVPWAFAAGWALDLFRGSVTRDHEDVEIAVPAAFFNAIQAAFAGYEFDVVGAGRKWPLADKTAFDFMHQTWLREPDTGVYKLDVFREPHDGDTWICRRDTSIRRPYAEVRHRTQAGLPFVAPEIVLLFKARLSRPKDQIDLDGTLPLLDPAARAWLRWALERVHPGHAWLERLE